MSKVEDFLSSKEEEEIIGAIRMAEGQTSGEIRIHIEHGNKSDAYTRAQEVFHFLKMDNTKLQNGVLIYIAVDDHSFAIYGDKGIHDRVQTNFWESTKSKIETHFSTVNFKQGLIDGVIEIGKQLEAHFPWDNYDNNELSNEISER